MIKFAFAFEQICFMKFVFVLGFVTSLAAALSCASCRKQPQTVYDTWQSLAAHHRQQIMTLTAISLIIMTIQ